MFTEGGEGWVDLGTCGACLEEDQVEKPSKRSSRLAKAQNPRTPLVHERGHRVKSQVWGLFGAWR